MTFPKPHELLELDKYLKEENIDLHQNFDPNKDTIFMRDTADSFRACAKQPTEQCSFTILNIKDLVNSPHGQFIVSLWRGDETRKNFDLHYNLYLEELEELVINGFNTPNTSYNVVFLLVADLSCVKELLGC